LKPALLHSLSRKVRESQNQGEKMSGAQLAMLSPYMTHHVKRFGNYVMDLETLPEPVEDDLPLPV
jgi:hypothetical protein